MAIITISRGSYSRGKEVAEKLAGKLGYECVSREVLLEAAEEFNIPEMDFSSALLNSPSILERFSHEKVKYIYLYKYALLKHIENDNVVYHGLAGQYILKEVPNVFKVRVVADMKDRISEVVKRNNITPEAALQEIHRLDKERRKWGMQLYGIDTMDSRLYDMVINIHNIRVNDAVDILYNAVQNPSFTTNEEVLEQVHNLTLAAKIHTMLLNYSLITEVKVDKKIAYLSNIGDVLKSDAAIRDRIGKMITHLEGIDEVKFMDKTSSKMDRVNPFYNI